jgi:flagellar hook protein FlgE
MFKSLYSGVSGLSANLTNLDVIGNNIANSNTVGFKTGRVTFNEMLTQTMKSASRPVSGGLGGTNAQQVGLGTMVGSIDTNFSQGNFQTTGKKTDLAIQGAGFFIMNDGNSNVYTRAGIFGLDASNVLVNPSTGLKVQGVMADSSGEIGSGAMSDIFIDPTLVVPAQPSSEVQMMGNLDSSSDAKGTVSESPTFLVAAAATDLMVDLSGESNGSLNMNTGNSVQISGSVGGVPLPADAEFVVEAESTYQDMVDFLNTTFAGEGYNVTFGVDPTTGSIEMTNNEAEITNFSIFSSNKPEFNQNFTFDSAIAGGGTVVNTDAARSYADETALMTDLFDENGESLDVADGDILNIDGTVGENNPSGTITVDATTTLGDLMLEMQATLGINSTPIEMNDEGQIVVRGEVGIAAAIGEISLSEEGQINSALVNAFDFRETQQASDQKTFSMATSVFDSLGGEHTVNFSFEKVAGENEWIWTANMEGQETILSGGSGRLRFSDTGSISAFTFDDGSSDLTIQPQSTGNEGAANIVLNLDYGEMGALTGLTQFEGTGNLQSIADGYGTGSLVDFNIDQSGIITGIFSNDTMQAIAQIGMATFSNADGLMREANNTYRRSGNSGQAVETFAGSGNGVSLVPGALETSNVDLAKEFTNLVVAQRAFQANSRVITTADQVMQELVNLVR